MPSSAAFIEGSNVSIGHLGIVIGAFDTLGNARIINRAISNTPPHHQTFSSLVRTMTEFQLRQNLQETGETVTVLVTNMTPEFWKILRLLGMVK